MKIQKISFEELQPGVEFRTEENGMVYRVISFLNDFEGKREGILTLNPQGGKTIFKSSDLKNIIINKEQ